MSERKILSVGIEKTASTSLEQWLGDSFGRDRLLIYNQMNDSLIRSSTQLLDRTNPVVNRIRELVGNTQLLPAFHLVVKKYFRRASGDGLFTPECLPDDFDAIHGHFTASRFDGLVTDKFMTVVLREPMERTLSHYLYWRRSKGVLVRREAIQFDEKMDFRDFAMLPQMQNFQTTQLDGKDLHDFDLVGIAEDMDSFVRQLGTCLDKKGPGSLQRLNQSPPKPDYASLGVDDEFRTLFKRENELDYANYFVATEQVNLYRNAS